MARPPHWRCMIDAARDEACVAVRMYNDPSARRSFEGFIVHMHLAWLYLLHAEFERGGTDIRYRIGETRRLAKVDGEPKKWELAKCVKERWPDSTDPTRANVEFFIGLRNKIEHRYTRQQEGLALAVGGRSQALLLNFEQELVSQFGVDQSLAAVLRFPVFIGTFTTEGARTLARLHRELPKSLRQFIADSVIDLPDSTRHDSRYDFKLRVVLELAKNDPNAVGIAFTRESDMTDEQKNAVESMGSGGLVIVREQQRGVGNLGWLKPREVVKRVGAAIPFTFNMDDFIQAWRQQGIRPAANSENPERTKEEFCQYDQPHRDYVYSEKWVKRLTDKLQTERGFNEFVGKPARKIVPPHSKAS
ncbi:DUF3644 domain-containing protein [Mycobacteroides saopaulense]|uniref:DUF3644 domain-containing protein n=1 Tax=Mycobacteroides saopaulense TaxID=1578165 RepID=UPI0009F3EFA6|nr:DUF3644 domain-containing protein [Mycobacteroides saopaulense]